MRLPDVERLRVGQETVEHTVARILAGEGENTRNDLAEAVGVSAMTVGKIVGALLRGGLLTEHADKTDGGRRPSRLRLTNAAAYVILSLEGGSASLLTLSATGTVGERTTYAYNDTMSPEDWLQSLRGSCDALLHRLGGKYLAVGLGVILGAGVSEEGLFPADAVERERELTVRELSKPAYGTTAVHLSLTEELLPTVVVNGRVAEGACRTLRDIPSRAARYERLAEAIAALSYLFCPGCIVVEGKGRYAADGDRLLRQIGASFPTSLPLPRLIHPKDITLAERAMLDTLNRRLAKELAKAMGR